VTRKWVVNASPLIILGKISQIDLLGELAERIVIPKAVAIEIEQGDQLDPAKQWLAQDGGKFIVETPPLRTIIANWDLGSGESHVLSWAMAYNDYEAIVDDLAARKCAQALAIPIRGTLGVLLLAKKTGLIPKINPLLNAISAAGLRIAPNLLDAVRKLADE
jgi:predicted nucleic acid-binding protein